MDSLSLLRGLTLAVRVAMTLGIVYVVVRRRDALSRTTHLAWVVLGVLYGVLAFDNLVLEVLAVLRRGQPPDSLIAQTRAFVYNATYLLHAMMSAALPAVLALLYLEGTHIRRLCYAVLAAVVLIGAAAIPAGAMETWANLSWERLLDVTRILSFVAIGGYLGLCALYVTGRLGRVDPYLAVFVGIRTVFILLLPVQEVILQSVGRETAAKIWHLHQFIQLATGVAQFLVVMALILATRGAGSRGAEPTPATA
ncbi:MAG TPA: hypothetical protein VKZ58_05540 [Longimicrobiales bacterium]|nr:hypothetical protein [Longimicrobiales bacterium]